MTDVRPNTPIDARSAAHKGETLRLLVGNKHCDANGHLRESLRCFNRAVELEPNFTWAIACRGLVNRDLGNLDDAIRDLERVIHNEPSKPWGYAQLGDTYRKKMDRSADPNQLKDYAINNFEKAIALSPGGEYAWAHAHLGATYCLLGTTYSRLEDWHRAKKSLETAIEQTHQSYAWAYAYMAVVEYKGFKNITKTLEYYKIAVVLDPRVFSHASNPLWMVYGLNGEENFQALIHQTTQA